MKKPRVVTIADAIPYFNVWVHIHPKRDNPQGAYLFPAKENKAKYQNVPLRPDSLRLIYNRTIEEHFVKLLSKPEIPLEDKAILKSIIYDKPHYPYLRRHEFATEIVHKVPQLSFNQLMGHSRTSKMYDIYVQDLGIEGNRELQIARGLISKDETLSPAKIELQPKYCPVCREPNKHDSDFCFKCNWVLTTKGMQEIREADMAATKEAENTKQELQAMKDKFDRIEERYGRMMDAWERAAQRVEKNEREDREQIQKHQPLPPYSSSVIRHVRAIDRIVGASIKKEAREIKELRKELHD